MTDAATRKVLFISGSGGLGHVTRDLAIARALREAVAGVEIRWLAAPPASDVIEEAGEELLPQAKNWADETVIGADMSRREAGRGRRFRLNVLDWFWAAKPQHRQNVGVFRDVIADRPFDLVIGDETYEIIMAIRARRVRVSVPFVMIYDFIGVDPMTRNPLEHIGAYVVNRRWAYGYRRAFDAPVTTCFIGEAEDIPDRPFGLGLPNRRRWAEERCHILGYVLPFDLASCRDKAVMRRKLGYGEEPLVVCAVGGWGVGKELLDLCVESYPLVKERVPGLRMVLVGGPRLEFRAPSEETGLEIRGYVPSLFEHFAASDLVVTQGGGTSTLELTALRRPFLYFPLEGHFEQQFHVAKRLERHGAGVRMRFSTTTASDLAEKIVEHIGEEVTYRAIPVQGAERLSEIVGRLLGTRQEI
jgi:UDP:flavonoid glycosyltransferase YjiC (YdhE family)